MTPKKSTGAMTSKNRKKVESNFKAADFNNFGANPKQKEDKIRAEMKGLFFNPAKRSTSSGPVRGRGGKMIHGANKKKGAGDYGERIMQIEKLSHRDVGLTF